MAIVRAGFHRKLGRPKGGLLFGAELALPGSLGRACGEAPLTLESCMRLIEMLQRLPAEALRPEALMVVAQALPEADADYTPVSRNGRAETALPGRLGAAVGHEVAGILSSTLAISRKKALQASDLAR
jgi:hypothetical protein